MNNINTFFDNNISNIDYENDNLNSYLPINYSNHINDKYINCINNIYYYPDKHLNKNIKINKLNFNNTHICIYQIIKQNNNAFLLFYLINNNNNLEWPNLYHFNNITQFNNLNSIDEIINKLYYKFDKNISTISFSGIDNYINTNANENETNDNNILWFKLNYKHQLYIPYKSNTYWISLYEILNTKKFLNITINNNISNYFLLNNKLIYLTYYNYLENKEINLDIPIIVYYGNKKYYNNFILKYDILKQSNNSKFGPYYYFCNFNLLKKYICFEKPKIYNYIRYAIFIKNYKYLLNNEIFNLNLWNNYDSIIYNYSNKFYIKYIIKNKNDIIPLSSH